MAPPQQHARTDRRRKRPTLRPAPENLETPSCRPRLGSRRSCRRRASRAVGSVTSDAGSGSPTGYTPQQIRAAYGFDRIMFGSIAGDGAGQTIAIVDAYDNPGLVDSSAANFGTSDLAEFDRQFGLPDPPSFTKINEQGNSSPMPATDPCRPGQHERELGLRRVDGRRMGARPGPVGVDRAGRGQLQ